MKYIFFYFFFIFFNVNAEYLVQEKLKPKNLNGLSDEQIDDHWKLYKGYVDNVNKLNNELAQLKSEGKSDSLIYSDRRRRYDFEYNGMVLHEYYFANLGKNKSKKAKFNITEAIKKQFGSYQDWEKDFKNTAKTRGIGWAILCLDPVNNELINIFVQDHENGNIASFQPILVMDIWEHAYMVDYFASEKTTYIDVFMKNINWAVVDKRYSSAINGKLFKRY